MASVPPRNGGSPKDRALRALEESGGDRNAAAAAAGVSVSTIKAWQKSDEAFAAAWDRVIKGAIDSQRTTNKRRERFEFPAVTWQRRDTAENREIVLQWLSAGATIAMAAEAIGVHRSTLIKWRKDDADFAADWDEAIEHGVDLIEEEAIRRAVDGVMRPMYQGGELVGFVREYSDLLLKFLLEGKRSSVYRRGSINLAAPNGGGELLVRWLEPEGAPTVQPTKPANDPGSSEGNKDTDK